MLTITPGIKRSSLNSTEQKYFDKYDKNGDGIISFNEYKNFIAVSGVNKIEQKANNKFENKAFNVEQFDPQGPINFESNGGFNAKHLNIIA